MNMFKRSRKAKEQPETSVDSTNATITAPTSSKTSKSLRRNKKKESSEEERPVFDLSTALPSSNDFRTSLMMPNLSARFSMLREQDDPASKIGKASDDSVLFPKRASRMNIFNHNPLTDIAEVESIYSSFRPPFADADRAGSISDGYASDDGSSIMARSRPGESNTLFGGRQKLYRIPTASTTRDFSGESTASRTDGKLLHQDNTASSMFQKLRLEDRERERSKLQTERSSVPVTEVEEMESVQSPSNTSNASFSRNRGTISSTNSGPLNHRTSTAATSVASDAPINRQSNFGNPGNGPNATTTQTHEGTANSSVDSVVLAPSPGLRKIREDSSKPSYKLSPSRSAINLRDTYARPAPAFNANALRAMSPPLSANAQPLDFGLQDTPKTFGTGSHFQVTSPNVQPELESEDAATYNNSVQPNDRGKATAMGLFNKPRKTYDDQQFTQRQIQLHEGRISPHSFNVRTTSLGSSEHSSRYRSASIGATRSPVPMDQDELPEVPPVPSSSSPIASSSSPMAPARSSSISSMSSVPSPRITTSRSRSKSLASDGAAMVKARAESLIKHQNAEFGVLGAQQTSRNGSIPNNIASNTVTGLSEGPAVKGTFLDNSDESDEEVFVSNTTSRRQGTVMATPPCDIHPALRNGLSEFIFDTDAASEAAKPRVSNNSYSSDARTFQEDIVWQTRESATDSNQHDPTPMPPVTGLGLSGLIRAHLRHDSDKSSIVLPPSPVKSSLMTENATTGSTTSSKLPITENLTSDTLESVPRRVHTPPVQTCVQPPTPNSALSERAQQILNIATAIKNANQTDSEHQRNESTETQKDQRRFDEELAERRQRINEGLKSVNERTRSRSPSRSAESQAKAMRMLGLGPREIPSPRIPVDQSRDNNYSKSLPFRQQYGTNQEYPSGRRTPTRGRHHRQGGDPGEHYQPPRSTTPSGRRERANSQSSDRSKSRQRYRDGPEPPMPVPRLVSSHQHSPPREGRYYTPSPYEDRTYERSASAMSNSHRERTGYFNSRPMPPPEIPNRFASPHSPNKTNSPQMSYTNLPLSPSVANLPSPNPGQYTVASGRATPTQSGRMTPPSMRKKSVTKGMISEPKFVSSTSSVPLVQLPHNNNSHNESGFHIPAIPMMNSRRRGTTTEVSSPVLDSSKAMKSPSQPVPGSNPFVDSTNAPAFRPRNRLRKSSSEGGNMAAKARQQALIADMARANQASPAVPVFPNRSATALNAEGGMF